MGAFCWSLSSSSTDLCFFISSKILDLLHFHFGLEDEDSGSAFEICSKHRKIITKGAVTIFNAVALTLPGDRLVSANHARFFNAKDLIEIEPRIKRRVGEGGTIARDPEPYF